MQGDPLAEAIERLRWATLQGYALADVMEALR